MAEHVLDFTQKEPTAKHLGSGRVPQVVKADVLTRSPAFDFRRFIAVFPECRISVRRREVSI
jgi:hypothetical protein